MVTLEPRLKLKLLGVVAILTLILPASAIQISLKRGDNYIG